MHHMEIQSQYSPNLLSPPAQKIPLMVTRNKAQDELAELRKILELSDDISLTEHITKIKINIDKE